MSFFQKNLSIPGAPAEIGLPGPLVSKNQELIRGSSSSKEGLVSVPAGWGLGMGCLPFFGWFPSKIEWDLTNGPLSKLLELLDTQV